MTQRRRPPLSPEAAAVVRAQLASRRTVLRGAGVLGLGAFLAACGTSGDTSSGGSSNKPSPAADKSDTDRVVNWANWTLYLDYDEDTKTYPTLEKFQEQTNIKATYAEDIDDNSSYYAKIQGQLANGQDFGKDVIVMTDWMAGRLIRQGYAQKLDKSVIPNSKNLLTTLQNVGFDPGRNYSLTWQSGYAGIAWNKDALADLGLKNGLTKVSDLWNPKLRGRVEVLTEFRDTVGLILQEQGKKIDEQFTADDYSKALQELDDQLQSGQIRQAKGNSYKEDLISGDALAAIAWSGDITQINFENDNKWQFALPESGGTLWSDNMLVPIGSPHKKNAEILMNYYYDPVVAAEVAAYVNYICPVDGAKEELAKTEPDLANDPNIFPTPEYLEKVHVFRSLTPAEETQFESDFQKVLGL